MDALDNLLHRYSTPAKLLSEPAPSDEQLQTLFKAAVTAPDHCNLQPWRFIVIRDDARQRLGEVFAQAYQQRDPHVSAEQLDNYRNKPLRAPLIIGLIAKLQSDNPKVPEQEQIISAALAGQHIQLAAQAMGFGSVWLTGINTHDWQVTQALGIGFDEKLIGYLYIGTEQVAITPPERPASAAFVSEWNGPIDNRDEEPAI